MISELNGPKTAYKLFERLKQASVDLKTLKELRIHLTTIKNR